MTSGLNYKSRKTPYNMRLPQAALVPVRTPVEGVIPSSRSKITKGGLRQAQARWAQLNGALNK